MNTKSSNLKSIRDMEYLSQERGVLKRFNIKEESKKKDKN
jgi:hypothetical protein